MARRTISVAETFCDLLSWRNLATLRRGTRYCWRTSSSTDLSMARLYTATTHTQLIHISGDAYGRYVIVNEVMRFVPALLTLMFAVGRANCAAADNASM